MIGNWLRKRPLKTMDSYDCSILETFENHVFWLKKIEFLRFSKLKLIQPIQCEDALRPSAGEGGDEPRSPRQTHSLVQGIWLHPALQNGSNMDH